MTRSYSWLLIVGLLACGDEGSTRAEACARLDETWAIDQIPGGEMVQAPSPRDLRDRSKLAVAVYHFNIQYVAGGLRGFPDGELTPDNNFGEAETEDRIVRQGIEPVLDLFIANPTFSADLEMQAYTLEIIALRHPDVLEKLKALVTAGQVEVDSFHYSDQLYVAYPRRDLEASLSLVERVFDRVGLPRGRSIFTQEGQFAVGQLPIADSLGYRVSVLPKNLFTYQLGESTGVLFRDPEVPGHTVILGGRAFSSTTAAGPIDLVWTFMDDGEIAFSKNRLNPYFGTDFVVDPAAITAHVDMLRAQEAAGFTHATIREAVLAMEARGIEPAPLPPVLDGTWQPKDTGNVLRWMGGAGLFSAQERDSEVLSTIWRARTAVESAERRISEATGQLGRGLDAAWREVALAAVSDSTGWNPFINEVRYSLTKAALAEATVHDVLTCAELEASAASRPSCTPSSDTAESLGLTITAPARRVSVFVSSCDGGLEVGTLHAIDLDIPQTGTEEQHLDQSEAEAMERLLTVAVSRTGSGFGLVQALEDRPRVHGLDDYVFERFTIPLPLGLIGLGDDRWLIQDQATSRLGATLDRTAEGRSQITFIDQTVTRILGSKRRYYLAEGIDADAAAALAHRINRPEL